MHRTQFDLTLVNEPSISRNLITRVLTFYHVDVTQSTERMEQKCFDLRSMSSALRKFRLLSVILNSSSNANVPLKQANLYDDFILLQLESFRVSLSFLNKGFCCSQSNRENREHQKNLWNVILLQEKSQSGVRKLTLISLWFRGQLTCPDLCGYRLYS